MLKIENLNVYLEGSSIVKNCSLEIQKSASGTHPKGNGHAFLQI